MELTTKLKLDIDRFFDNLSLEEAENLILLWETDNSGPIIESNVIPTEIPDHIYIALEEIKCERYGMLWETLDKQIAFIDGQCAAIDLIEEWLKSLK
jgi:hypothetical protein